MSAMSERIYRDPVHNIIRLRTDTREGRLLVNLVDAPEFQRLRRIKQLGLALYTYQGAAHPRFAPPPGALDPSPRAEHARSAPSLGVLHLITRVLDRLGENYRIDEEDRAAARAAAPPPDVGHGAGRLRTRTGR